MGFKDHFSDVSADYARARPGYPAELFEYLAGLAPGRQRAWDCATGTGQAAAGLSGWFDEVRATDASRNQIDNARPVQNIQYSVSPAENTPFPANFFDLVNVSTALHWFDMEKFYGEVRRVTRPGGILAVYAYTLFKISPDLDRIIKAGIFDPIEDYWPPERKIIDDEYRTIPFPFEEVDPPEFSIAMDWSFSDLQAYLGTWSAVRNFEKTQGEGPLNEAMKKLRAAWGSAGARRSVSMELFMRVGRVFPN